MAFEYWEGIPSLEEITRGKPITENSLLDPELMGRINQVAGGFPDSTFLKDLCIPAHNQLRISKEKIARFNSVASPQGWREFLDTLPVRGRAHLTRTLSNAIKKGYETKGQIVATPYPVMIRPYTSGKPLIDQLTLVPRIAFYLKYIFAPFPFPEKI